MTATKISSNGIETVGSGVKDNRNFVTLTFVLLWQKL
jgi:hypothetical protein